MTPPPPRKFSKNSSIFESGGFPLWWMSHNIDSWGSRILDVPSHHKLKNKQTKNYFQLESCACASVIVNNLWYIQLLEYKECGQFDPRVIDKPLKLEPGCISVLVPRTNMEPVRRCYSYKLPPICASTWVLSGAAAPVVTLSPAVVVELSWCSSSYWCACH